MGLCEEDEQIFGEHWLHFYLQKHLKSGKGKIDLK